MSIVQSLIEIVEQEMGKHGVTKLSLVRVKHGKLTNIVPEALDFAWEALTNGTRFEGSRLEAIEIPLKLECGGCKKEFEPDNLSAVMAPCPYCEEQLGHKLIQGREMYIENIEAE